MPAEPRSPRSRALALAALGLVLGLVVWVFAPFFADTRTMGFQDWDSQAAYRYVTRLSLSRYGQAPWWNPWFCGGFPAWGYAEGATNFVSPWLPIYLALPFPLALRVETVAASLVGVLAAYLFAGRYTRSPAWRAFVAAIWMLCSRWSLQVASGHLWHLAYAWTPLALYFFDRAVRDRTSWANAAAGATLALIIYVGGIYPYPHTVLVLGVYAAALAATERRLGPLTAFAATVATSIGLAAPKLFPVIATMSRFPRYIASHEPATLRDLWVTLTAHDQSFGSHPLLPVGFNWVWWEWGAYVGVLGALALVAGLFLRRRSAPLFGLKLAGLACVLLSLGQSTWQALHALPVFRSQHVPSRLVFPGILLLATALAGGIAPAWERLVARRPRAEVLAIAMLFVFALDLAIVARQGTDAPFRLAVPAVETNAEFHQEAQQRYHYGKPVVAERRLRERYDWPAKLVYPSMLANTGIIRCYGVPPEFKSAALGSDQPGYRGLVFLASGAGHAEVVRWTPNAVTIRVTGARPGDLVVYDMSHDPGWRADGSAARNWHGLVAAQLTGSDQTVHLAYRPQGLGAGLLVFGLTAVALTGLGLRLRSFRRFARDGREPT